MKKLIYKIFLIGLIISFLLMKGGFVFLKKNKSILNWEQFYISSNDKKDILFMGSSISYSSFIPREINVRNNVNSYNLSSSAINTKQIYFNLKEAIKYNNPKVLIIEAHSLDIASSNDGKRLGFNYQNIDGQKIGRAHV